MSVIDENFAQIQSNSSLKKTPFFSLTVFRGDVFVEGSYRIKQNYNIEQFNKEQLSIIKGGVRINSKGFIWHPNFMIFDLNAKYSPMADSHKYLVLPNTTQTITTKMVSLKNIFLRKSKLRFTSNVSLNQAQSSRDNLTFIKSDSKNFGGNLNYNNKFIPFIISYQQSSVVQEELQTENILTYNSKVLQSSFSKSFYGNDKHMLRYSHNEFENIFSALNYDTTYTTIKDNVSLNNFFNIDSEGKYQFVSGLMYQYDNTEIEQQKFIANESLKLKLPQNFQSNNSFNYSKMSSDDNSNINHGIVSSISHGLYSSLNTNAFCGYNRTNFVFQKKTVTKFGGSVNYRKKILTDGLLNISYKLIQKKHDSYGEIDIVNIIDEEQTLTDGNIVLLANTDIELSSIVVTDENNAIIYQENVDYFLIVRDRYVEIQRIPGGLIANNSIVHIDYTANQIGNYKYSSISNNISASVSLFKNVLNLYFSYAQFDYKNIENINILNVDYYKIAVIGSKVNYKIGESGFEYQDKNSSIFPYKSYKFFANVQKAHKKISTSLNANAQHYLFTGDSTKQTFVNLIGNFRYRIFAGLDAKINAGYRYQNGDNINLEIITLRNDYKWTIRKLSVLVGIEVYRRKYMTYEKNNFINLFINVRRRF